MEVLEHILRAEELMQEVRKLNPKNASFRYQIWDILVIV